MTLPLTPLRELTTVDEVRSACGDDILIMWAAQGCKPGVRAWALGDAVAVTCPELMRRDRLTISGDPDSAAVLVRHAHAECGPTYRLWGAEPLVRAVVERVPELESPVAFYWMDIDRPAPDAAENAGTRAHQPPETRADWLAESDAPDISALLEVASPSAYAVPGLPGVRRWAGVRRDGELVAVAADAWSAPTVGFIAGVATAPAHRGKGYGEAVCRLVAGSLLAAHGRVALMVDADNPPAIRLYKRLGMVQRGIAASRVREQYG